MRWRSRANRLVARLQILVHCNFGACTAELLLRTPFSCHARSRVQPQAADKPFSTE